MRQYGRMAPTYWTRGTGKKLRGDKVTQLVALYLMGAPGSNMIGMYYCPISNICHDIGLTHDEAAKAIRRLTSREPSDSGDGEHDKPYCFYDWKLETVFVVTMARRQLGLEDGEGLHAGDKRAKGIVAMMRECGSSVLLQAFYEEYRDTLRLPEPWWQKAHTRVDFTPGRPFEAPPSVPGSPFEAPSKPLPGLAEAPSKALLETQEAPSKPLRSPFAQDQDQAQEQEHDQEQAQEGSGEGSSSKLEPHNTSATHFAEPEASSLPKADSLPVATSDASNDTEPGDLGTKGQLNLVPPEPKQAKPDPVREVFDYWASKLCPRGKLDDKRRSIIGRALKNYSVEELCKAVDGTLLDDWRMGRDPKGTGKKYIDIELVFRDAGHIDPMIALAHKGGEDDAPEYPRIVAPKGWNPAGGNRPIETGADIVAAAPEECKAALAEYFGVQAKAANGGSRG